MASGSFRLIHLSGEGLLGASYSSSSFGCRTASIGSVCRVSSGNARDVAVCGAIEFFQMLLSKRLC